MKTLIFLISILGTSVQASAQVDISLANNTHAEKLKKEQIERVINEYDLSKWWFTEKILIDEKATHPHSHPVLTLGTKRPYR